MKVAKILLAIITTVIAAVQAGGIHDRPVVARHHELARRSENSTPLARSLTKRCRRRPTVAAGSPTSSHASHPTPPPSSNSGGGGNNNGGTIGNLASSCGPPGATSHVTKTSGPNGNIHWLNCGVDGGGWRPPHVRVSDLVVRDLAQAVNEPGSPFIACRAYIHLFERYAAQFNVPAILMASFAMQESSCQPNTVGGAGEQGLMQLTRDKCGGAPGGNCRDPDFNIRTGTRYFRQTLDQVGGNVVQAVGTYNGWHLGLTHQQATAAAFTSCCRCQNNLDYLHQFFNGWCQNINAYDHNPPLGTYFNLLQCH